jgi:hypothetical protein
MATTSLTDGLLERHYALDAIQDVFDAVVDAQSRGEEAPSLRPAVELAEAALELDDPQALDAALTAVAHAAVAVKARTRAAYPELGGPSCPRPRS